MATSKPTHGGHVGEFNENHASRETGVPGRKMVPFSGDRRERVLDAKAGNLLPRVQVFRKEARRAALGGGDDERIPEADPRFVFDTECHGKLGWSGFHAP